MKHDLLRLARYFGYDITRYGPQHDPHQRLRYALQRQQVTMLLDIGANIGQFGQMIRMAGYRGAIVSFEPLSDAYARLQQVSRHYPLWTVAARCAIGAKQGEVDIQIAGNSQSSSILNMLDRHVSGDPKSVYVGKERVTVITLDDYLDTQTEINLDRIGIKIDTQGYEQAVLQGLQRWRDQTKVIRLEMSLVPLYEGAAGFSELYSLLTEWGYHCVSIEPNFIDPKSYEVLQVDAVFERCCG